MIDDSISTEKSFKQTDDDDGGGGSGESGTRRDGPDASSPPSNNEQDQGVGNSATRTQAAFINKLYRMLEDPTTCHLICWSENGDLFSVINPTVFSRTVLPQYFKHNNWQSFVRQLNMYGFHKVNDMIHSNFTTDNQNWEFRHPSFRRGAVEELKKIKRKSVKSRHQLQTSRASSSTYPGEGNGYLLAPVYRHLLEAEDRVRVATHAYEVLLEEINALRSIIAGQQEIIADIANTAMMLASDAPSHQMRVESLRQQLAGMTSQTAVLLDNLSQPTSLSLDTSPPPSTQLQYLPRNTVPPPLPSFHGPSDHTSSSSSSSGFAHAAAHPLPRPPISHPIHQPNTQHRLPSISSVGSRKDFATATGMHHLPLTALSKPAAEEKHLCRTSKSTIHSPFASSSPSGDGSSNPPMANAFSGNHPHAEDKKRDKRAEIEQIDSHAGWSNTRVGYASSARLGLGSQSWLLNPVPAAQLQPPFSRDDDHKQKGVKRLRTPDIDE